MQKQLSTQRLLPKDHPLANLAGVGVAYKLAEALLAFSDQRLAMGDSLLDLVALGLIADVALTQRGNPFSRPKRDSKTSHYKPTRFESDV